MLFLGPASYYLVTKRAFATPAEATEFARIMASFVAMNAPEAPIAAPYIAENKSRNFLC